MALQIALMLCLVSGEVDPKVVADRIEAATTARDLMLEYEGTFSFPGEEPGGEAGFGEGGLAEKYVGLYATILGKADWSDVFDTTAKTGQTTRHTVLRDGDRLVNQTYVYRDEDHRKRVEKASWSAMLLSPTFGQLHLAPILVAELRALNYLAVEQEPDIIDGHECERFTIRTRNPPPEVAERRPSESYWVDMKRGGQVIRKEHSLRDRVIRRAMIELAEFKDPAGNGVWVPISGRIEAYSESGETINLHLYKVFPESVRVNQGLRVADLSVGYKPGAIRSEAMRKAIRDLPKTPKPAPAKSLAEMEAELKAKLAVVESEATERRVEPEPARGIFGVLGWAPVALISIAGLALVGIWIARRMQA
ncbi:MAG: hypothetical protein SFX72_15605 [Isosphaeraceae bacterium]|nr:hypothetical protein [Isosphaeraceae bacterium]